MAGPPMEGPALSGGPLENPGLGTPRRKRKPAEPGELFPQVSGHKHLLVGLMAARHRQEEHKRAPTRQAPPPTMLRGGGY